MTHERDISVVYRLLAGLTVGQPVPASVYVADYADGSAATWTLERRTEMGHGGVLLLLVDKANGDLFDCAAVVVMAFPKKILRTPVQPHGLSGEAILGSGLCDLMQQGRYADKRSAK